MSATNYFLKGITPPPGVDFCDFDIDGKGIVVDEENLQKLQTLMSIEVVKTTKTKIEGVVEAEIQKVDKKKSPKIVKQFKVVIDNPQGNRCDHWIDFSKKVEKWIEKNMETIGCDTFIHMHTKKYDITPKGLHITIGSEAELYETHGNSGVSYVEGGYKVSFRGGYFERDNCPEVDAFNFFCKNLLSLLPILIMTEEDVAKYKEENKKAKYQQSKKNYINECSKRFEKTLNGTKEKAVSGKKRIDELQKELVRVIREVSGAERKLEQLLNCKDDEVHNYEREFDSLLSIPGIEDVHTVDGVIKVFTEHVYITPDKCPDTFDIGKFRMEINTSGSNGGIRFFNLTRQGTGSDFNTNHPHVNRYGQACLGNIQEMIANLIGGYEYSAVAQLGLQFLNSVNTEDSAGKNIFHCWPKKEK